MDDWTWKYAQVEYKKDETHNSTGANAKVVEDALVVVNIVMAVGVVVDVAVVFVAGGTGIQIVGVEHFVVEVEPEKTAEIAGVDACP